MNERNENRTEREGKQKGKKKENKLRGDKKMQTEERKEEEEEEVGKGKVRNYNFDDYDNNADNESCNNNNTLIQKIQLKSTSYLNRKLIYRKKIIAIRK